MSTEQPKSPEAMPSFRVIEVKDAYKLGDAIRKIREEGHTFEGNNKLHVWIYENPKAAYNAIRKKYGDHVFFLPTSWGDPDDPEVSVPFVAWEGKEQVYDSSRQNYHWDRKRNRILVAD